MYFLLHLLRSNRICAPIDIDSNRLSVSIVFRDHLHVHSNCICAPTAFLTQSTLQPEKLRSNRRCAPISITMIRKKNSVLLHLLSSFILTFDSSVLHSFFQSWTFGNLMYSSIQDLHSLRSDAKLGKVKGNYFEWIRDQIWMISILVLSWKLLILIPFCILLI